MPNLDFVGLQLSFFEGVHHSSSQSQTTSGCSQDEGLSIKQLLPNNGISEKALISFCGSFVGQKLLEISINQNRTFLPSFTSTRISATRCCASYRCSDLLSWRFGGRVWVAGITRGPSDQGDHTSKSYNHPFQERRPWHGYLIPPKTTILLGTSNLPLGEPIWRKNICKRFNSLLAWGETQTCQCKSLYAYVKRIHHVTLYSVGLLTTPGNLIFLGCLKK